jgi:hypothetical protein
MSSTFVTAVDAGGSASPKSSSPVRSRGGSPQHNTVRRLEDEEFHFIPGDQPQLLPHMVDFRSLLEDLLDTVIDPDDVQSQRVWSVHVPSDDFNAIVSDLFWYCFLHIFRKATGRKLSKPTSSEAAEQAKMESEKQKLLDRVSSRYGSLFYSVVISGPLASQLNSNKNSNSSTSDGDILFQDLSNVVAQALYISFFQSYPRSRRQINSPAVRDELVDVCGLRLDGVRPSLCKHTHWLNAGDQQAAKKLPSQAGGKGKTASKTTGDTSFVRAQSRPSMPIQPRVHLQKRRTRLGHTPMLRQYLPKESRWEMNIGLMQDPKNRPLTDIEEKKIEDSGERKQNTSKNRDDSSVSEPTAEELDQEEQEELLQQSMKNVPWKTYLDVVTVTRTHAKILSRAHKQKYAALNSDLSSGRRQVRKEQKSIDEQCRDIQGRDSHEFSNYIVSRMDLQSSRKKK